VMTQYMFSWSPIIMYKLTQIDHLDLVPQNWVWLKIFLLKQNCWCAAHTEEINM
jgi:hypothetical protein